MKYLKSALIEGCDTTSDVIILCSDGVIPTHKLVLASISKMLYYAFKEDTWDERISILMPDFTVDQMSKYLENLYCGRDVAQFSLINSCLNYQEIDPRDFLKQEAPEVDGHIEENNHQSHSDYDDNGFISSNDDYEEERRPTKIKVKTKLAKKKKKIKEESQFDEDRKLEKGERPKISESRKYFVDDPEDETKTCCTLCDKKIKNGPNCDKMMAHLRHHHPEIHNSMKKKKIGVPQRIHGEHYENIPDHPGKAACKLCSKTMWSGNILRHLKRVHSIFSEGEIQKEWLCSFCGKVFYDKYTRDSHETLVHTKSFKHVCSDCGRGFVSKGALDSHTKTHAMGHSVQCSDCGNVNLTPDGRKYSCTCGKKAVFRNPMWGLVKEYQCSDCGQQFCQKSSLTKHQAICKLYISSREGGDSLTCRGCGQKFSDFKKLRLHSLHSTSCMMLGDKAFPCKECDKQFRTEKRLNIHMRVHTGETPYHCNNCPRKFKYLSHLKNHNCSF